MGKLLGFFIKSAVDQKTLKLGVVIAWTISIVQKHFHCYNSILEEFNFLARISQRVYSMK